MSNGNGANAKTIDERIKVARQVFKQKPADSFENKLGRKITEYLDMVRYLRNCAQHADTGAEVDEVDGIVVVTSMVQISKVLIMLCNKAYLDKKKSFNKDKEKEKEKEDQFPKKKDNYGEGP